jgi:hypothetical protein
MADPAPSETNKEIIVNTPTVVFTETHSPYSEIIDKIYWDADSDTLGVELNTNGVEIYVYENVAPEIWTAFKNASSAGRFYNDYIKGQYESFTLEHDEFDVAEPTETAVPAFAAYAMASPVQVTTVDEPEDTPATLTVTFRREMTVTVTSLYDLSALADDNGFELDEVVEIHLNK